MSFPLRKSGGRGVYETSHPCDFEFLDYEVGSYLGLCGKSGSRAFQCQLYRRVAIENKFIVDDVENIFVIGTRSKLEVVGSIGTYFPCT